MNSVLPVSGTAQIVAGKALTVSGTIQFDEVHHLSRPETCEDRAALFLEFEPLIRRLMRQYQQTPDVREELRGELYWRFDDFVDRYDPSRGIPLRPYLVRQLSLTAFAFARRRWRQHQREVHLEDIQAPFTRQPDPTPQWDTALADREMSKTLPGLIARLPLRQRKVVVWRYYEERSYEQIAALLNIEPATARSMLRHALNRLRQWVDIPTPIP
jgi:RNA polymerase sigma factor (sigma-70 family)